MLSFIPSPTISRTLALAAVGAAVLFVSGARAAGPTNNLVGVLQSNAGFYEEARACQQLGETGGREAVPALAALLGDEHLAAYARSGLEGIAHPSAAAALRAAAARLKGDPQIGAINSLGVLRDAKATALLSSLAAGPEPGAARAATLALGRIANSTAIKALRRALSSGPEALRPEAAAACLMAAETELARGRRTSAARLYDAVQAAAVPASYRAAAVRGAILAGKPDRQPALLVQHLRSVDRLLRHVALLTIREIPGNALAGALNAELAKADPDLQVQILIALVDCHNAGSIAAIKARLDSDDAEVRRTALTVLGRIGGPADAATFVEALRQNRSPEEAAIAWRNLERMEGAEVERQLLRVLATEAGSAVRLQVIRLVASRGMNNAVPELFRQAADPDPKLRVAALDALNVVAGPQQLPALVAFARSCADETVRDSAGTAIVSLCRKSAAHQAHEDLLLAGLKASADPAARRFWLGLLTSLGCARALPILKADLGSADADAAAGAVTLMGGWPDPAPVEDLLTVAESGPDPARQARALRAAVRLATAAADDHQRPDAVIVEWLRRADRACQTVEDRRLVLSGLGRISSIESFRLVAAHLDGDLENEAGVPLLAMALPLAKQGHAAEVKETLDKLAATAKGEDLRKKAAAAAAAIPQRAG